MLVGKFRGRSESGSYANLDNSGSYVNSQFKIKKFFLNFGFVQELKYFERTNSVDYGIIPKL